MRNLNEIPEKYKKNLGFIEMMIADCEAWVKYYDKAIDDLEEKLDRYKESIGDMEDRHSRMTTALQLEEFERRIIEDRLQQKALRADMDDCIESILYWKLMVNKWKGEYAIEKTKQELSAEESI